MNLPSWENQSVVQLADRNLLLKTYSVASIPEVMGSIFSDEVLVQAQPLLIRLVGFSIQIHVEIFQAYVCV